MTLPTQSSTPHNASAHNAHAAPRITPFASGRSRGGSSSHRGMGGIGGALGSTRGLFIAVAVLGLGGAAAGWLLTHKSDTPANGTVAGPGAIVDPLANPAGDGSVITIVDAPNKPASVSSTTPATALGTPNTTAAITPNAAGVANSANSANPANSASPANSAIAPNSAALRVQQCNAMIGTDPVRARAELTRLLDSGVLSAAERLAAYQGINSLAEQLFFSARIVPGDTVSQSYIVKRGDSLTRIGKQQNLGVESNFIQRVNAMPNDRALRPDMRLKLVHGPFDAEVVKADYRLNVYSGQGPDRVMVASFPCGLGANDSTPVGSFRVRAGSKLKDPEWRNPRTGEYFSAKDPLNPIGERWIGLQGSAPETAKFTGYGIHGTVEPQSIGQQSSMGCVRLGDAEVQVVYELLSDASTVVIR